MGEGAASPESREDGCFQVPESVQEVADPTGPAEPQDLRIGAEVGRGWVGPTAKELEGGRSLRLRNATQGRASS